MVIQIESGITDIPGRGDWISRLYHFPIYRERKIKKTQKAIPRRKAGAEGATWRFELPVIPKCCG
jgi:hypothetical protein